MEEYTVNKKGTDEIYYVLQMAKSQQDIILLANYETGEFAVVNMQQLVTSYEFNELLEEMDDETEEEDAEIFEEEGEEVLITPDITNQPISNYPPQQPTQTENRFAPR